MDLRIFVSLSKLCAVWQRCWGHCHTYNLLKIPNLLSFDMNIYPGINECIFAFLTHLGSTWKCDNSIGIPIMTIRRSVDRLIIAMGILILVGECFIELAHKCPEYFMSRTMLLGPDNFRHQDFSIHSTDSEKYIDPNVPAGSSTSTTLNILLLWQINTFIHTFFHCTNLFQFQRLLWVLHFRTKPAHTHSDRG